jgi:ligand-binding sensor domain-containing protein/serine phosphatase RsbU (regulator of sigma subunit)
MKYLRTLLIPFVLWCTPSGTVAQQYNFKNFSVKNGLAGSIVNSIYQDSKGYVWFGTQGGGISKFNGKTFQNFTKADGLVSNDVTFITEDLKGNIWIATADGVSKFNGTNFSNITEKQGLSKGTVFSILADSENKIWFAVAGQGIQVFDGKKFISYTVKDGLPSNEVYSIQQDKAGNYWFGAAKGIARYDGKKFTSYSENKVVEKRTFFSSCIDSKGTIWFGGNSGSGVVKFCNGKFETFELPFNLNGDFIGGISEDKRGNIWFATDHGVLKYAASGQDSGGETQVETGKSDAFRLFTDKQGLAANASFCVHPDDEGKIWVGTMGGGVSLFSNETFINYTEKEELPDKIVNCIFEIDPDKYLVGTNGAGLRLFDATTNKFTLLANLNSINQGGISTIVQDTKKNIWIGVKDGIQVLKKTNGIYQSLREYRQIDKQKLQAITKIIQDHDGNIWASSFGSGIFEISGQSERNLNTKTGLASDNIFTVFEDHNSNIWFGTNDAGVIKYDGKSFVNYSEKDGLPDKSVWSICEDANGIIYFGTGESGIVAFDGKKFIPFNRSSGLISDNNSAIVYDTKSKCIWSGTDKGINEIKINSDYKIEKLKTFAEPEGFQGSEVTSNAIMIDSKGLIWFGTTNGLSCYNREFDRPNTNPFKIHIADIRLAYQTVNWKNYADSIDFSTNLPINPELSYHNNNLSFDFQACTTDNVRYSFMLEGQDDKWSPLSASTEAVFTNIAPGKSYTFKVKAVNNDGLWSDKTSSFSFAIKAPWWQTWWFRIAGSLFVVVSLVSFFFWRTTQLRKHQKLLRKLVSERTVELTHQKEIVEHKNKEITASINYAQRIQKAILPSVKTFKEKFENSFILYNPKDIVAGDFYWLETIGDLTMFAACDCTGHGVPGAMVSVVCHNALNRAIREMGLREPSAILDKTAEMVIESFSKSGDEIRDGMDISLCVYNSKTKVLEWAGANNPLFFIQNGELTEIKGDKQAIGKNERVHPFKNHSFQVVDGIRAYIFSDGFADQFGGKNGKKLTKKRFNELLLTIQNKTMGEQGLELEQFILNYRKDLEQTDDILIIGVQF